MRDIDFWHWTYHHDWPEPSGFGRFILRLTGRLT